jgi:hypothetical protein
MGRVVRLAGAALAAGLAVAAAVLPAEGGVAPDIEVVDSNAVAASIGVITRVPAESPGGLVFTTTAITLDKAIARAAGLTGGEVAESFLASSTDGYRNPTLVSAQYPPTPTSPSQASIGPASPAAGADAATARASATEQPIADAEAVGGRATIGTLSVRRSTSSSHSEVGADGTVVTRALAVASAISIADLVSIATATTEAVTTVAPGHRPTSDVKVTLAGLEVAGVAAELTDQGLRLADQVPVGPGEVATFNAALAALAAEGVTVAGASMVEETAGDRGRAEGGALVVRYSVADQVGGDEEFVVAQASSRSVLVVRTPLPGAVTAPALTPAPPVPPVAAPGGAPAPVKRIDTTPVAREVTPAPGVAAHLIPVPPPTVPSAVVPSAAPAPELNLLGAGEDPAVGRLLAGYRIILVLAVAGAALHVIRQRTRLA